MVLTGQALFKVDGFDASPGGFVYVPDPTSRRGVVGCDPGTALVWEDVTAEPPSDRS